MEALRVHQRSAVAQLMEEVKLQLITPEEYREQKVELTARSDAAIAEVNKQIEAFQSTLVPQQAVSANTSSQSAPSPSTQVLDSDGDEVVSL